MSPRRPKLTAERARELLSYDKLTGLFHWKVSRQGGVRAGDVAGCTRSDGYVVIWLDCQPYYAHRLAFLIVEGRWPGRKEIDHKNGNPSDNRWCNLRKATHAQNSTNRPAKGVSYQRGRSKPFKALITQGGQRFCLGHYETEAEAVAVYRQFAAKIHGRFTRQVSECAEKAA
jgi:hypothetical protein